MNRSGPRKRAGRTAWKAVLRCAGTALILLAGAEVALRLTPFPAALETAPPPSTEFVDRTGQPLRMLLAEERRYAQRCTLAQVAPSLLTATIAAEDRRFFTHHGVDPLAATRALWQYAQGRPPASGASTITMQLVKLSQPGPRTVRRKLVETWLALRVERSWSKERILTEYLNRLDYGNLQVGIASASRFYFGKPASDLSRTESAFLAGLPKAPTRLNPHQHFAEAHARAEWIQRRVAALNLPLPLPLHLPLSGIDAPLHLRPPAHDYAAPHFVDLLLSRRDVVPARGGEIRTTLDLALNRFAERAIAENLHELAGKNATAGAAVVLDNVTGDVLALAGAATEAYATDVNTAWMIRSPGSAMKPFTYLLALEKGNHPGTIVPDVPTDFPTSTGSYRPNNYNHRFYGPVSLRFALGNSLNVGAIRALELAGGPEALQRAMLRAGITTLDQPTDYYGLGLTLGNGEVRLLELANAYATLARLGEHRPFRLLLRDTAGARPGQRIFDADAAYLLADMLADNTARASSFGLNSWLHFDFPVACKTGTSSDYRDNWCIGYTPEFTVAVWVGNPDGKPMREITGVTGAAPVMHDLFEQLHRTRGTGWYVQPPSVRTYTLDPLTGRQVAGNHPGGIREKCLAPPPPAAAGDYDEAGRVVLPPVYSAWLASPQNSLGSLATTSSSSSSSSSLPPLEILEPPAGSLFYLDPDLPRETQCIPLRAATGLPLEWNSPTLTLTAGRARLAEGWHQLTAREPATGRTASTWIEVKGL
ncbi:MAG TPA: transglycosylase domain-containing protein [Chthoniobacteraceae bacterium]|jgi:penicillin-binding protein 1C|nr:transglycosylase domain-containing protein [Chthoniobacteraceae bacterium]